MGKRRYMSFFSCGCNAYHTPFVAMHWLPLLRRLHLMRKRLAHHLYMLSFFFRGVAIDRRGNG